MVPSPSEQEAIKAGDVLGWYRLARERHQKRPVGVPKPGRRAVRSREQARMAGRTKPVRVLRVRKVQPVSFAQLARLGQRPFTRRNSRAWQFALTCVARAAAARRTAEREAALAPFAEKFGRGSELYWAAVASLPNGRPNGVEKAIAREKAEPGDHRVALAKAAQRLDLIRQRDHLSAFAAAAESAADQARAEAERLMRDGARLVRALERLEGWDLGSPSENEAAKDEALAELHKETLRKEMTKLYGETLAAAERARANAETGAKCRAQAKALSIKLGKTPGVKTRQERIALARQVGAAAA